MDLRNYVLDEGVLWHHRANMMDRSLWRQRCSLLLPLCESLVRQIACDESKLVGEGCYQFHCLVNRGTMGVNSLPNTVTRQRRGCDLNPGRTARESIMLTTRNGYTE